MSNPPWGWGVPSDLRYFGVFGGFLRYFGPNEDLGTFSDFRYLENELYHRRGNMDERLKNFFLGN